MVNWGCYSASLVRAKKVEGVSETYFEHRCQNSGEIFAEVEPEDEYFIEMGNDSPERVFVDIMVDGIRIEQGRPVEPRAKVQVGVCVRDNNLKSCSSGVEKAILFAKTKEYDAGDQGCEYWTGCVKIVFFGNPKYRIPPFTSAAPYRQERATISSRSSILPLPSDDSYFSVHSDDTIRDDVSYGRRKNVVFTKTDLSHSRVGYVPGKSSSKQLKGVKSAEGSTNLRKFSFSRSPERKKFSFSQRKPVVYLTTSTTAVAVKEPVELGSISIRYCSTIGLIYAGILKRPDNWDVCREVSMYKPGDRCAWNQLVEAGKVKTISLISEKIKSWDETGSESKEVVVVDLSDD